MSAAAGYGLAQLAGQGIQGTFDELGTPLREVTFVVVDLETTGGAPETARITEIGAVKVRGGEVLGEFQTLVNPETAIPPFIAVLTGITDAMVAGAPAARAVLPAFLEFAARQRAGRAQRAVRRRLPQGRLRGARARLAGVRRSSTPRGWPAGSSPATRRPTASSPPWRGCSGPRPRPTTARSPTPGPPSTSCTG